MTCNGLNLWSELHSPPSSVVPMIEGHTIFFLITVPSSGLLIFCVLIAPTITTMNYFWAVLTKYNLLHF